MTRALLLLLLVASASACSVGKQRACRACSGTLSPTTCSCSCGWTRIETLAYSLILLPLAFIVLIYF